MKKLLNILAVSVGSGVLLGAGLRALEGQTGLRARVEPETDDTDAKSDYQRLAGRLNAMEQAFSRRLDAQQTATERLRLQQDEAETLVAGRIAEIRQEAIDTLLEGVQRKVVDRIARLEEEVAGQSAAMSELRECSLKTERSVQKLIEGIDRLVSAQPRHKLQEAAAHEASRATDPVEMGGTEPTGSRLRSLFG